MLDDYATTMKLVEFLVKVWSVQPLSSAQSTVFGEEKNQKIDDPWLIFISHIWLEFKNTNTMETAGSMILMLISNTPPVRCVDGTVLHA